MSNATFSTSLTQMIEKYNTLAIKYKELRSQNKELATTIDRLKQEVNECHALMSEAVTSVVDIDELDNDEEEEEIVTPSVSTPAPVQSNVRSTPQSVVVPAIESVESESEELDDDDEKEVEEEEDDDEELSEPETPPTPAPKPAPVPAPKQPAARAPATKTTAKR